MLLIILPLNFVRESSKKRKTKNRWETDVTDGIYWCHGFTNANIYDLQCHKYFEFRPLKCDKTRFWNIIPAPKQKSAEHAF